MAIFTSQKKPHKNNGGYLLKNVCQLFGVQKTQGFEQATFVQTVFYARNWLKL